MVAGEPSADVIGASFLRQLRNRHDVTAIGVGGPELQREGLTSIFAMEQLSVMGFVDVALRLPQLLFRIEQTVRRIIAEKPDLVVLIDSQVFSSLVAKKLRKRGYSEPIVLYVAPSVWAWKPERAPKLLPLFNEILAVLPFEPAVMDRLGGPPTTYVGHPALARQPKQNFSLQPTSEGKIVLLPGSRRGEIRRHMPILSRAAEKLANNPRVTGFVIPTLPHLAPALEKQVSQWAVDVEVVSAPVRRDEQLGAALAAIATAGTITLELALMGLPHIGTYVPDHWQMKAYEKANKPLISLTNNILGREAVPEIFPGSDFCDQLVEGVEKLLNDDDTRNRQLDDFKEIRRRMEEGMGGSGRHDAVERILAYLIDA